MNATALKYSLAGTGSNPPNYSGAFPDAPLLFDQAVGDTTTNYAQTGASPANLVAIYNLGSGVALGSVQANFAGASANPNIFTSSDGISWGYGPAITGLVNGVKTALAITAQYVAIVIAGTGAEVLSDFRLWDSGNTLIAGPLPGVAAAPTFGTITTNTINVIIPAMPAAGQTLNLQRSSDAGTTWTTVSTNVTPGATVPNSSLSPSTTYAYRVATSNGAGTTNGGSASTATIALTGAGANMENPTFLRGVQLGVETTPGTAVAATQRVININTVPTKHEDVKVVKGQGTKGAIGVQRQKTWSEGRATGALDYDFIAYILAGMISSGVTPTTVGTLTRKWTWVMRCSRPDVPQTYTMEYGNELGENKQYPFMVFSDMSIKVNETTADYEAGYFARQGIENVTMTAGLSDMPSILSNPLDFRVNFATTYAGLSTGTPKLTKLEDFEMHLNSHWKSVFFIDDAQSSFSGLLERSPSYGCKITAEQGTDTDNLLLNLRNRQLCYVQLMGTGALIEVGTPNNYYMLKLTMPVYVVKPDDGDYQEVYSGIYDFEGANDETNGNMLAELWTTRTAL